MSIEAGLYSALVGDGVVAANVGTRVYPETIPQEAVLPAIAYQVVAGQQKTAVGGGRQPGLSTATVQVTITAEAYSTAKEVEAAIRAWFPFRGFLGGRVEVFSGVIRSVVDGYGAQIESPTVRLDLWFLYSDP